MKKLSPFLLLGLPAVLRAQTHSLEKIWETDTIVAVPESVLTDATHSFLFVSLIDGGPWDADGKGGVGKLSLDGKQYTGDWITGLNAPKGLGRFGNRLYVADISNVVVIDIAKGSIIKKIGIDGATGLNDITVDGAGIVYVSDSKAGKVYRIEKDTPTLYMDNLDGANGLMATNTGLYILAKKAVLFADGGKELLLDTHTQHKNTADIHYDAATHTLYIPEFFGKAVAAWKLN